MNLIDKAISIISPETALRRAGARKALDFMAYADHGASTSKRSTKGWNVTAGSPDTDITLNLETLRTRSRDVYMGSSPLGGGALRTMSTNVIGAGLMLNAQLDYKFLGMTADEAADWERNTEREFKLWANTVECDAGRKQTFGQIQYLVMLSKLMSGDVFVSLPMIKRKNQVYDIRVQVIEGDRVKSPVPDTLWTNSKIFGGIETDDYGAPLAYWIAKKHPSDKLGLLSKADFDRVPAYGSRSGRRNILHILDLERPSQRRGVPILAPVLEQLKMLNRYSDAELMAAVISSMFTVFIKSQTPQHALGEAAGYGDDGIVSGNDSEIALGNGAVVGLNDGEDISVANPARNNASFDAFVTSVARQIGARIEIPYELLLKHFQSSYSASRAALLEAWKMFRTQRVWMSQTLCQPIYEEWLSEAVAKGRIEATGFFEDPAIKAAYCGAKWVGSSQGQLDPLKEVNAAEKRVLNGFSTREHEAAEMSGQSFDDIVEIRIREEQLMAEVGNNAQA